HGSSSPLIRAPRTHGLEMPASCANPVSARVMGEIHALDIAVVAAYAVVVVGLGRRAGRRPNTKGEEGFFLAGRKLGKAYQFFLNFGNATDANNAVSTASLVYQQGVSGAWLAFQMIFMNPYFWFMNL